MRTLRFHGNSLLNQSEKTLKKLSYDRNTRGALSTPPLRCILLLPHGCVAEIHMATGEDEASIDGDGEMLGDILGLAVALGLATGEADAVATGEPTGYRL